MSIATLTSLIVKGGTISSQLYDSIPPSSSSDAPLTSLFEELNTLNAALSRLLTALLDPRRARCVGPFIAQLNGILSGCQLTYEELNDDIEGLVAGSGDNDKDVVQFWRRVQAHAAGLELLLTVIGTTGLIAVETSQDVAVQPIPLSTDDASVSVTSASISASAGSDISSEAGNAVGTTTTTAPSSLLSVPSVLEDAATLRQNSLSEPLNERHTPEVVDDESSPVAIVSNIKEVIPLEEQIVEALDDTTQAVAIDEESTHTRVDLSSSEPPMSPNPKEIIDEQTRESLTSPLREEFEDIGVELSAILSPPLSPNPKEIVDENIRHSFIRSGSEGARIANYDDTGDVQSDDIEAPNIKEVKRSEGKMALDEDKSMQQLQKAVVMNQSERIGGPSSGSEPILRHRDAQPTVLPEPSLSTSRIIAASKPDTPITETEEILKTTAISRTRETAIGRAPIENTATNASLAITTIETSESETRQRGRCQSVDAPPSLKSDSTASLASLGSLQITPVDVDMEVVSQHPRIPLSPAIAEISVAELQGTTAAGNSIVELPGSKAPATMISGKPGVVTLGSVLRKETKPPYSFNNFKLYMRDEAYALELLECWVDMKQHNDLCNFFVLERLPESTEEDPTPSQVSAYIRSIFTHPHHHHHTSPQHLAAIANADAGHSICRADLKLSADSLFCRYLDPGADKDVTGYLKRETWESVKKMLDPKQEGRVDPEAFLAAWREVEEKIEKDYFPGFMKKRRVFMRRFFK